LPLSRVRSAILSNGNKSRWSDDFLFNGEWRTGTGFLSRHGTAFMTNCTQKFLRFDVVPSLSAIGWHLPFPASSIAIPHGLTPLLDRRPVSSTPISIISRVWFLPPLFFMLFLDFVCLHHRRRPVFDDMNMGVGLWWDTFAQFDTS
jgi:hypothetical protein